MKPSAGVQHLSYTCPGLHGPESRNLIEPRKYSSLLSGKTVIVIPLIQRAYCWTSSQFAGWWGDVVVGRRGSTPDGSHGTGKAIFTRQGGYSAGEGTETLVCIDGQQRVTTTMLLTAAFRDAALATPRWRWRAPRPTSATHLRKTSLPRWRRA